MARTYITTNNSRGRQVTAMSPTFAHIRGWNAGVEVDFHPDGMTDRWEVYMTTGSNGPGDRVFLGTVTETPKGPVFIPVRGRPVK